MLTPVQKGTLVVSVSGRGQVSVTDQVEISSKASGTVSSVLVKDGQTVAPGTILVQIDSRDNLKMVCFDRKNAELKAGLRLLKQAIKAKPSACEPLRAFLKSDVVGYSKLCALRKARMPTGVVPRQSFPKTAKVAIGGKF